MYRRVTTKDLSESSLGKIVQIAGWVKSIRDHGKIVFIDLRDEHGVLQLKTHDQSLLTTLTKESVISVEGQIIQRDFDTINKKIRLGTIELEIQKKEELARVKKPLPNEIDESFKKNENARLRYRYLDMRSEKMHQMIKLRSSLMFDIRKELLDLDFVEVQTPILTSSSPEGARDFLVPSRLHKGMFYALPQAPQQFKQLLMCAGVGKYFQIAPCFRDEDSRADRSPGEFYQVDMEMSFATQEDVFEVSEKLLKKIFKKYGKFKLDKSFPKITFKDSMTKYGTDKPDLRNPLEFVSLDEIFEESQFDAFRGKTVEGIAVKTSELPRSFFDKLTEETLKLGGKGLAYVRVLDDYTLKGPIVKFISEKECKLLIEKTHAKIGDDIFVIADKDKYLCYKIAGMLRTVIAEKLDLIQKDIYKFAWIVDFPMFEKVDDKIEFSHNPFSMPQGGLKALETCEPTDILAYQYDIVVNGIELSSGAVRNYDLDVMLKAFEIAGYDSSVVKEKFGALYTAFEYGVPPHAGIAPGLDRIMMLLLDEKSIREVVAFPMNSKAIDVMMGAPGKVSEEQLREIHIKVR